MAYIIDMQHTVSKNIEISGIGLHSGKPASIVIKPSKSVDYGIVFKRTDIMTGDNEVKANYTNVINTTLCTVIGKPDGSVSISTIEHLMAALRAMGVDNALVEIDGPEVPILDGSSEEFCLAIDAAGTFEQDAPRRVIKVKRPVKYKQGDAFVTLTPSVEPVYKGHIDYSHPSIGSQRFELRLVNGNFRHDVADCRTFCLFSDVEMMKANNRALGGSLENAVVIGDNGIMNEGGLNCDDEFVRHKVLDAVGDLALSGGLIIGTYEGSKAGHGLNYNLLKELFSDPLNYEIEDFYINLESSDEVVRTMAPAKVTAV